MLVSQLDGKDVQGLLFRQISISYQVLGNVVGGSMLMHRTIWNEVLTRKDWRENYAVICTVRYDIMTHETSRARLTWQ